MEKTEYRGTASKELLKEFETTLHYVDPELELVKIPSGNGYLITVDFKGPAHYDEYILQLQRKKLIMPKAAGN